MKFHIAACLAFALWAPSASANLLQDALATSGNSCWARTYDEAHLKAHPSQNVSKIRLSSEVQDDGTVAITLGFKIRGKEGGGGRYGYNAFAYCRPNGPELKCIPEWEAGHFSIKSGPKNALTVVNHGLIINPSNYDSEDIADNAVNLAGSDDKTWILRPVYPENCDGS